MYFSRSGGVATALVALTMAASAAAQSIVEVGTGRPWPSGWTAEWPLASGGPQERRLPVLDNEGRPIAIEEIMARVDPSGVKGAVWGALGGAFVGLLIGARATQYGCDNVQGDYYISCSPREDAMAEKLPSALALLGAAAGAWLGWNRDVTTFQEALREIRHLRTTGGMP